VETLLWPGTWQIWRGSCFWGNLDKIDTKNHFQTSNIFVNEILLIWAEVNYNNNSSSLQHYKTQGLWNNSLIRIDRKPVYFREWLAKGILTIESLMKDETFFPSYAEFLNKYHCKGCPLAFSGIITTLKTIRKRFKENIYSLENVEVEPFTKAFQKTKKPSNLTYRTLVATKSEKPRTPQTKWHRDCDLDEEEIDWKKTFQLTRSWTKSIPSLLFSNSNSSIDVCLQIPFLYKIAVKDSDRCTFCKEEAETLLHVFWQCNVISHFWENFFRWLQSCSLIQKGKCLDMTTALGLKPDISNTKLQINFSCLVSRYCIWVCKLRNEIPNLPHFLRLLGKNLWNRNKWAQPSAWKIETSPWPLLKC